MAGSLYLGVISAKPQFILRSEPCQRQLQVFDKQRGVADDRNPKASGRLLLHDGGAGGIVANGKLQADGQFEALEVLAKHDENYMPPEVADALAKAGVDMSYSKGHQQE